MIRFDKYRKANLCGYLGYLKKYLLFLLVHIIARNVGLTTVHVLGVWWQPIQLKIEATAPN